MTTRLARGVKPDLLISDVDGTLVTSDKVLTPAAIASADRLETASIGLTLISARPPRGMMHVIGPMQIKLPFAAFNGGVIVSPDGTVLQSHPLAFELAARVVKILEDGGVDVWVFAGEDWLLKNADHPNVSRERHTVNFEPTVVSDVNRIDAPIGKIVGVSSDYDRLDACEAAAREALAGVASVTRSQKYYLDISSLAATKGQGVAALCELIGTPLARTAVIGDMYNDISMFDVAGLAIAMGQAPDAVKARAQKITRSNAEDGFATAVENLAALSG